MSSLGFKTLKEKFLKEVLWYYTFCIILIKCIAFVGLSINTIHLRPMFFTASRMIFTQYLFRPVFYICFIVVFLSFAFLLKNRARMWYLIIFNLLVSIILLVDLWYMRGYNTMASLHLLNQTTNLDGMTDSILSVINKIDIIFVFDIFVVLAFVLIKRSINRENPRNIPAFAILFVLSIVLMFTIIPITTNVFKVKLYDDVVSFYDSNITSDNLSPIGYHVINAYSYWKDTRPVKLTETQKQDIKTWYEQKNENLPDNKYKGMFKGKNLIVIQVESLEKFVINQKINGQEVTPTLNKLLKNSLYFSNYYEQVNNGMSSDADLMTNTGMYPIRSGATFFRYPFTQYNSLPKLLRSKGYTTYAYHPDKGSFWNWMPALSTIGFQNCIDSSHYNLDDSFGFGISDGSLLSQVEPMMVKQKQPFYSFIVTLSGHMPFLLPDKYKELNLNKELDQNKMGGYLQCAHYEDKHIGIFLDNLKKDGLLDNSVVVIYGDHEGIHRYYPNDIPLAQPAQDWWQNNHKLIPLIIYSPGLNAEEIKTIGGQVDVLPTISYLLGVDQKEISNSAVGRNLLNTNKSFAVMEDRNYISDRNYIDTKEQQAAIKGLDISDMLIRSNYFKQDK